METKNSSQSLDRISQLPDALLVKILSSLPTTKEVVATSVLSKQWQSLWKMVPKLTFSYNGCSDLQGFSDSVRRTMLSLEAPYYYLQSLHLHVSFHQGDRCVDFGELVRIACGLHVRELVLKHYCLHIFRYPISLYNFQSLETLKLYCIVDSIVLDVPYPVCLKSLRTLHLEDVFYEHDESVVNLLAGCVRLENLIVIRWGHDGVETFTVDVPSLQELTIEDNVFDDSAGYVINTPSLKKLTINAIGSPIGSEFLLINAPELVEAKIWTHADFLRGESLSSVKRLSLSISRLKVPAGSIFNRLEYLQLLTEYQLSWNPLMVMLDNSPNLQVIEIISEHDRELTWKEPKHVPQCFLHLKKLDWLVRRRRYGEEVAEYILSEAKSLENVILRIDCDDLKCAHPEEDRLKVCHDMERWCPDGCKFELIVV